MVNNLMKARKTTFRENFFNIKICQPFEFEQVNFLNVLLRSPLHTHLGTIIVGHCFALCTLLLPCILYE